jgi:hypothetical protein
MNLGRGQFFNVCPMTRVSAFIDFGLELMQMLTQVFFDKEAGSLR